MQLFRKTFDKGPGVYIVDHVPTGMRYVGYNKDPKEASDKILLKLREGKYPHKELQKRYDLEPDMDVYVFHTRTVTMAKEHAKSYVGNVSNGHFIVTNYGDYYDVPKVPRRRKRLVKVES